MIISKCDNLFIVHILKNNIGNINIFDIENVTSFFKKIIMIIKNKYDIKGFCNIFVYYDDKYGMILEIDNYCNYMVELDIKIEFHLENNFMIEIDDIDSYDNVYYYRGKYYTNYRDDSDNEIIYKDTFKIIYNGLKIK